MDKIILRGLEVSTVIGTAESERLAPRMLLLDIELSANLEAAGKSDDLRNTVDYAALAAAIRTLGTENRFFLIERFANEAARLCLAASPLVAGVTVRVEKAGCVSGLAAAVVEIRRER
ncbi:MAG: dihydroneopterin aldolase [Victivallaceae bacterium]|nr:dihydroneopterin aldolase [Victivallaceae bacterium]